MSDSEYVIPASDTQGHSARHYCRTIPQMARQVEQIVASRTFPYRTKGDLIRHAIHRHVRWLLGQKPVVTVSGQVDTILEIMRDEEMNADFVMVFDKLGQRISTYLSSGANGEAVRLVRMIQENIKAMPEGFWRDRYEKQIRERYGHLLKNQAKASLGEVERD